MDELFPLYQRVAELIQQGAEHLAREEIIKLLDIHQANDIKFPPVFNHLIREVGLYPYLDIESARWDDRFVHEAFKVDIGKKAPITLHREQSALLKRLLEGDSIAVSAPTSFGKSFIIDSFISLRRPTNVAIIVPTIALTDETRRRLYPKFSRDYKIITTTYVELAERNIFIFPQERAIEYSDQIKSIDILVIDEFYKASSDHDSERAPALLRAMLKLGAKAKQKYFLAPNISRLADGLFTRGVKFIQIDFNTVILEKFETYKEIGKSQDKKNAALLDILAKARGKTLIYAGTYADIDKVSVVLSENFKTGKSSKLLKNFSIWLNEHYSSGWMLADLVRKGVGIHNGQMHRSLSQIQIKLFEEEEGGLQQIISTSSIIEGVNTSAENVVLWRNKNGSRRLNDFTYKNIIGRGGRMFKHFIGKVYLLEEPPAEEDVSLTLDVPDQLLNEIIEDSNKSALSKDQISRIIHQREELSDLMGEDVYEKLRSSALLQLSDWNLIKNIVIELRTNPSKWRGLSFLHSDDVDKWDKSIYNILNLRPGAWDIEYSRFVEFIKVLSQNWNQSTPALLKALRAHRIGVDVFFKLERNVSFKFSSLLHDVNLLQKELLPENLTDVSPFVSRTSHAFLPRVVFELEEYGLPRVISRKIDDAEILDMEDENITLHKAIATLNQIGLERIISEINDLKLFDKYILKHFFDGIATEMV